MDIKKIIGIALLVAGTLALVYGGFWYTSETHNAELGPIEFQVTEQERFNVPVWAGVAMIGVGALFLLLPSRD